MAGEPSAVPSARNCSDPVGVPLAGEIAVSVAVKVMLEPVGDGLAEELTALAEPALLTVKLALVPVSEPPLRVAVIVLPLPTRVTVTLSVLVPPEKVPDTVGLIVPAVVLKSTVPAKLVTVLLLASWAVMLTLNGDP